MFRQGITMNMSEKKYNKKLYCGKVFFFGNIFFKCIIKTNDMVFVTAHFVKKKKLKRIHKMCEENILGNIQGVRK